MTEDLQRTGKDIVDVYRRHIDMVYRICRLYFNCSPDAEDAAQDTFVRLIRYGKQFQSSEHEKAWLIVTAKNVCRNMLRSRKRETVTLDSLPEDLLRTEDTSDELLFQLLSLPEKYKVALYLFYYEGYKTAEIARMLGRKDATIRSDLLRGRELLKLRLKQEE